VIITSPGPARGQDDPAVHDAQARFQEGLARVQSRDFEAARISFAEAYAVLKRPAILWNLALAEEKTGHALDALVHFKRLSRDPAAPGADREDARHHAQVLMAATAHLDVQAPSGAVVRLDGEVVRLDGEIVVGGAPVAEPLDVAAGRHVIEAQLAPWSRSITVDAPVGVVTKVALGSPPPALLRPVIVGPSPAAAPPAASVDARERPTHEAGPASGARTATVAAMGGAGAVSLGAAVYLAFRSRTHANTASGIRLGQTGSACTANPNAPACADLSIAIQEQNRDATWSNALYVTGGALAAGAVVTWFVWPRGASGSTAITARAIPTVGPGELGVSVDGRF
jgi:hypothetical protein